MAVSPESLVCIEVVHEVSALYKRGPVTIVASICLSHRFVITLNSQPSLSSYRPHPTPSQVEKLALSIKEIEITVSSGRGPGHSTTQIACALVTGKYFCSDLAGNEY